MIEVFAASAAIMVLSVILMTFIVGAYKVLRDGVEVVDQLDRAGFGPEAFWNGTLPKQDASASAGTSESLNLIGSPGRVSVRQARTVSRELF